MFPHINQRFVCVNEFTGVTTSSLPKDTVCSKLSLSNEVS